MPKPVFRGDNKDVSKHTPGVTWGMLFDRVPPLDEQKEILREKLLPFLIERYPHCPIKMSTVDVSIYGEPEVGASIRWQWYVWVHGLSLRVSSWNTFQECALASELVFKVDGDHGGTPGFATVEVIKK